VTRRPTGPSKILETDRAKTGRGLRVLVNKHRLARVSDPGSL